MPLEKISKAELARLTGAGLRRRGPDPEYVKFLRRLKPGEYGRAYVSKENATKQTIKNRLGRAAQEVGVTIRYVRATGDDEVRFLVSEQ